MRTVGPVSRETDRPSGDVVESLFAERAAKIDRYVDLLISAGVDRGLLGPREPERVWGRHILNCAVIAPLLARRCTVCDIGSGAGLPGVVLALARPDVQITLLEPLQRRVTFLEEVVEDLDLGNVVVRRGRAEDIRLGSSSFDIVTARAVAPLERLVGWGLPLLRAGGELLALKGRSAGDEVAASAAAISRLGGRHVRVETCGLGIVDPPTIVVRIESSGTRRRNAKGV